MSRGIRIIEHWIDFPQLQRCLVVIVADTDSEAQIGFVGYVHKHSVHEAFNLDFPLADSLGFVPMKLGNPYSAVRETYSGDTFTLAPAPLTVNFPEPGQCPYRVADCKGIRLSDSTNDLEVHP